MQSNSKGPALKAIRTAASMTLDEVSELAGVSTSYLSRVENGQVQPTDAWIATVAIVLGDRIAELAVAG